MRPHAHFDLFEARSSITRPFCIVIGLSPSIVSNGVKGPSCEQSGSPACDTAGQNTPTTATAQSTTLPRRKCVPMGKHCPLRTAMAQPKSPIRANHAQFAVTRFGVLLHRVTQDFRNGRV